jgi:hypothetical protein
MLLFELYPDIEKLYDLKHDFIATFWEKQHVPLTFVIKW